MDDILDLKAAWDAANAEAEYIHSLVFDFLGFSENFNANAAERGIKRMQLECCLDNLISAKEDFAKEYDMFEECEYTLQTLKDYLSVMEDWPTDFRVLGELTARFEEKLERDLCAMKGEIIDLFTESF